MVTKELVDYIRSQLVLGRSRVDIQKELFLTGGWQVTEVDEAFASIEHIPRAPGVPIVKSKKSRGSKGLVITLIVLAVILVAGWLYTRHVVVLSQPTQQTSQPVVSQPAPAQNSTPDTSATTTN